MDEGQQLLKLIQNPTFILASVWVFREFWQMYQKNNSAMDQSLSKHTDEMTKLGLSMARLEIKIENLEKLVESVPEMQKDLNAFHAKLRQGAKSL